LIKPSVEVVLVGGDGEIFPISPRPHVYDWFLVPQGEVTVDRRTATGVWLRLTSDRGIGRTGRHGEELPDVPVGDLPIATLNPNTGELELVSISLPPPPPLTSGDVDAMWGALSSLPSASRRWVRRRALWEDAALQTRWSEFELFVASLPDLLAIARHLVTRWPQREHRETYWRPVELAGGREDGLATLRRLGQRSGVCTSQGPLPERSLRRRGSTVPWELAAVALLAAEVSRRVQLEADSSGPTVMAPLDAVASVARPRVRRSDPSPSSWPPALRGFHDAALDVLATVIAASHGEQRAPLCHLWALYEGWVSSQVVQAVAYHKGRPPDVEPQVQRIHRGGAAWVARWRDDVEVIDVWGQLNIESSGEPLCDDPAFTVRSVTSTLIPDALVAIRRAHEERIVVIDAKFRSDRLDRDDAATGASKYHWGLRAAQNGHPVKLSEVVLVTSGKAIQPYDPTASRISVQRAVPHLTAPLLPGIDLSAHL
jgi:hypothetical protein